MGSQTCFLLAFGDVLALLNVPFPVAGVAVVLREAFSRSRRPA